MNSRRYDLICVGRAAVDLYGEQIGARLEDVTTFARYLGGSPANTAIGAARLGLRAAMLTRVGDEQNGRFVRDALRAEGVDVGHVRTDPERLTALVFLSIRDRDTFPLLFYRDRCADMALCADDVDGDFVGSATAVLISGTHLSQPGPRGACERAIALARERGTRVVLDIDYRPVLWGLTNPGLGERRYVASDTVSASLQPIVARCDLVVGTEEEIHIAGGSTDTAVALATLRAFAPSATIVMKRGPMGCTVYDGLIPADPADGRHGPGFPVEVFNVLGAGDAFMAGFLRGWLRDEPIDRCCRWANACGALVVSRHGCAPAMPSWTELQRFVDAGATSTRVREDETLEHLHRATTRTRTWPQLAVLAFDHRAQLEAIARRHGAGDARIRALKQLIADGLRRGATLAGCGGAADVASGAILDDRFGAELLPQLTGGDGWIARPVEQPHTRPLRFEHGTQIGLTLRSWPAEQVAKCLVLWHPDDPGELREQQAARLRELQQACVATSREWLLEVLPPPQRDADDGSVAATIAQLYACGLRPDWWKLPPAASDAGWRAIGAAIARGDPHCRGVLLLGLEAAEADLHRSFALAAAHPFVRGFAVGRSIFLEAAIAWFDGRAADDDVVERVAARYARLVSGWRAARASPAGGRAPTQAAQASEVGPAIGSS